MKKDNLNSKFIKQIKKEITPKFFRFLKGIKREDYTEGWSVTSIWSYESTAIPMIIDIRESLLDEMVYLESWIYFLKDDGNLDDERDYEHYDGFSIISYEDLQKESYCEFICDVYEYANEFLLEYLNLKKLKR